jgi:hypothetical protein
MRQSTAAVYMATIKTGNTVIQHMHDANTQAWTVEVLTEDTKENPHIAVGYLANVAGGATVLRGTGHWDGPDGFIQEDSAVIQATVRPSDLDRGETPRDVAKGAAKAIKDNSNQDAVMWRVTPCQTGMV